MRSTFEETVLHETSVFKKVDVVFVFLKGGFGRFRKDFCEFVGILARNRDGK